MNIELCNEKLNTICKKNGISKKGSIIKTDGENFEYKLKLDIGIEAPLFYWRKELRFSLMKNCLEDGTLSSPCMYKAFRIESKNSDIRHLLCREVDICLWLINDDLKSVYAIENASKVLHMIFTFKLGIVAGIEVAATISPDMQPNDKHEIFCLEGSLCDRQFDAQTSQSPVNVLKSNGGIKTFFDTSLELFGLDVDECGIVKVAFDILTDEKVLEKVKKRQEFIDRIIQIIGQSARTGEKIMVGEKP